MNDLAANIEAKSQSIFRTALLFEGGLAVVACIVGLWIATPPWRQLDGGWVQVGMGLLATAPMLLGLLAIRRLKIPPLVRLNDVVDRMLVPLFSRCNVVQLALISLAAGVGEEFLFRGVIQPFLIGHFGVVAGIGLASVVFGLVHWVTPTYAVLATIVGVYLGWLALATGSLIAPIVAHGLYDFLALVLLTKKSDA